MRTRYLVGRSADVDGPAGFDPGLLDRQAEEQAGVQMGDVQGHGADREAGEGPAPTTTTSVVSVILSA